MCYSFGMRTLAIATALVAVAGCSTGSKPAAPTPTPAPARTPMAAAAATPFDPLTLPPAHRLDAARLPGNVLSSLAFIHTMLEEHKDTMQQVTCYCCGKPLSQCYMDTATKAAKACSPL